MAHNSKEENRQPRKKWKSILGRGFLIFLFLGQIFFWFIACIYMSEEYRQVYKNPLLITATVVDHDMEVSTVGADETEHTTYVSYITYTVDGKAYKEVFERENTQKDLTPIGQQVTVAVHPDHPGQQLSTLRGFNLAMPWVLIPVAIIIAVSWDMILQPKSTVSSTPGPEKLVRDLRRYIYGRFGPCFWFLLAAGWGLMYWRYPAVLGLWLLIMAIGSGCLWIWRLVRAIQALRVINDNGYIQRWAVTSSNRASDATSEQSAKPSILEIYLPGNQVPVLRYTVSCSANTVD